MCKNKQTKIILHSDKQTDRQVTIRTDAQRERETERETVTYRKRQTYRQIDRQDHLVYEIQLLFHDKF